MRCWAASRTKNGRHSSRCCLACSPMPWRCRKNAKETTPMTEKKKRARLGALALAVLLAGCADMKGIDSHAQLRSNESVGLANAAPSFLVPSEWWRDFGDARLDQLVAQALAGNPSLKVAHARLAKAQAATEGARST